MTSVFAQPGCHPDYDALIAIYNATGGATWSDNTGWIDGAAGTDCTPCSWYGVTCDGANRVTTLALNWNNLTGTLPTEIGDLSELQELNLVANTIGGSLPVELGNLSKLEKFELASNQFTGTIPTELGNLTKLIMFRLDENQLTGTIPVELGNFSRLQGLDLSINQLTGTIPVEFGNLKALAVLKLNENQLTGTIPSEIGNLKKLIILNLSVNQLTGSIPVEIGGLTEMHYLYLNDNQLSGCFPNFLKSRCPELAVADMNNNPSLTGDFTNFCATGAGGCPEDISFCHPDYAALMALYGSTDGPNWTNNTGWVDGAAGFDCDVCNWHGVSCNIYGRVSRVDLSNNQLSGTIPTEIGDMTYLQILMLERNQLTGTIPAEIGYLSNLFYLSLNDNQLSGMLPLELGNLTELGFLSVSANQLSGNIPAGLGNFGDIIALYMNDNQLSGCFPESLSNLCPSISYYDFSSNPSLPNSGDFADFCANGTGACAMELAIKIFLQGPFDNSTDLMGDDLRQASLLPSSFGGNNLTGANVLATTGNDAIVDWVEIELRPSNDPSTVISQRAALLQRDGDVVDVDGVSPLNYDTLPAGDYHIAVKHRNHLGIMSNMTVTVN